jgi:hypothetical protein
MFTRAARARSSTVALGSSARRWYGGSERI